jgi:hypothetical protein
MSCFDPSLATVVIMNNPDHKIYWDLFETVIWICSRDENKVIALRDRSDQDKMASVISVMRVRRVMRSPPRGSGLTRGVIEPAAPEANQSSMEAQDAFEDLLRKVQSRRVRMTAINCRGSGERQIEVPLPEINGVELRMTVDNLDRVVAGLWSRSSDALAWRAPQFLRVDVIGAWPVPRTKTAAVSAAILRHLREIMTPERRLTKAEAKKRCLAEVPNAYPEAFRRAWEQLEAPYKKRRGQHGKRAH